MAAARTLLLRTVRSGLACHGTAASDGGEDKRACRVLLFDTSSYHYRARRRGQADIEKRIKEICETRVRYG